MKSTELITQLKSNQKTIVTTNPRRLDEILERIEIAEAAGARLAFFTDNYMVFSRKKLPPR